MRSAAEVHAVPALRSFAVLDTQTPPFDDRDVRHAVNFALDRDRLVEIFGGAGRTTHVPTTAAQFPGVRTLLPVHGGPAPGGRGPWSGPDMEEAQGLVGFGDQRDAGRTRVPALVLAGRASLGDYFVELLESLDTAGACGPFRGLEFYSSHNEFQMALDSLGADYPAASSFLSRPDRFACNTSWAPSAGLCDRQLDAAIERAARTQAADPIAAAALWAAIERRIVDQAPYLWLDNSIQIGFVSEDVGNYQYSLQWEVLLNQLWVL